MTARRAVWFNCFSGIAGDMALAGLLDAGASVDDVNAGLASLGIAGLAVRTRPVSRCGIAATAVDVLGTVDGRERKGPGSPSTTGSARKPGSAGDDTPSRPYGEIAALIESARLPERVRTRAGAVFAALAEVEGPLHGLAPRDVVFHEIGGHDALADVVGTCLALESLGIDAVHSGPVALGTGAPTNPVAGSETHSHGNLPNPAPATLRLLGNVPVVGLDVDVELTTPTGAALLAALVTSFGPMPQMTVEASGYGAGTADLAHGPNCVQAVVGTLTVPEHEPRPGKRAGVMPGVAEDLEILEANLDDATGEELAHTAGRLMESGALDAWITPSTGKKGRPAHTVSVLCDPASAPALASVLVAESGTLGVRRWPVTRYAQERLFDEVVVDGNPVRIKVARGSPKPEYDDLAAAARTTGRPLRDLARDAVAAWTTAQRRRSG